MRVVVLGAGYVGLELCRRLATDHDVTGVRRSDEGIAAVEATGASAVRADVTDDTELSVVPDCDVLVFAASSGGRGAEAAREVYVDGLRTVTEHFAARPSPPERLVYTSSTSVYGDHGGEWVDEETPLDPQTEKTEVLVEAERVAREEAPEHGIDGTVVRFAGLYGPDRYRLERYVEGPVTEGYLNMLHRDDAAGVLRFVVDTDPDDEVLLAVDDEPVDRWSLADWLADECGVEPPEKRTTEERLDEDDLSDAARRRLQTSKRCSNDRLHELGYGFEYPTYRAGYRAAIEAYRADIDLAE
ncbi:SDR family oxidoreductase [Halomarina salina]|uniref:SDR family oxidoreductase n=1 Tax=Halomarina salina TaxID=1872699 RepID=A0ABD5RJ57_9EURY|nr:SDR family oxidoreductase [Halomarina salina]